MPNICKDNNWKKKSQSIRNEESKEHINVINNSNGSLNIEDKRYQQHREKLPQSIPRNKNYMNYKNGILNKDIILPNVYGNNKSGVYNNKIQSPRRNINVKNKSNGSYKILNSENNVVVNNLNNIKIIDGKNIHGNVRNNNSIGLKKKKYLINQMNNDIGKMILEKRPMPINYNIGNKYNQNINEKDFLKILQQKKKRIIYYGKNNMY